MCGFGVLKKKEKSKEEKRKWRAKNEQKDRHKRKCHCSYCETIFNYMHFDIQKKGIFRKKVVLCPVCDKPVKATMIRARESEE